ncbi:beta-glucosidase [Cryptococcus neoformans]|nr:beta-glucosidase [Cryptococcus neoformans var. grubii]
MKRPLPTVRLVAKVEGSQNARTDKALRVVDDVTSVVDSDKVGTRRRGVSQGASVRGEEEDRLPPNR